MIYIQGAGKPPDKNKSLEEFIMTKKQVMALSLTTLLALGITFSGSAASISQASNSQVNPAKTTASTVTAHDGDEDDNHGEKPESFDAMMKDVDTTKIPSSELTKLRELYTQITALEANTVKETNEADHDNSADEALWTEFDKILTQYVPESTHSENHDADSSEKDDMEHTGSHQEENVETAADNDNPKTTSGK